MRTAITVLLCFIAFALAPAEARTHKHRSIHHHHHYTRVVQAQPHNDIFFNWFVSGQQQVKESRARKMYAYAPSAGGGYNSLSAPAISYSRHSEVAASRPSDCYGIAWCGCWLKHHLGVASSKLNLNRAIEWARLGSATTPHVGAIVVWAHHVGKITGQDARGNWIVLSGNSGGRTGVTEVPRSINRAVAFREI